MLRGYFSCEIRGVQGEACPPEKQWDNLDLACQKAQVIRQRFPDVNLFVPHEVEVLNNLYFGGDITGDDIVDIERVLILSHLFDFVVTVGECHTGTGVDAEAKAAHLCGVPVIFIDDVEEVSMEILAQRLASMSE